MSERKIGAGHVAAMARLGLKELRNAANPSRESVADTEIGLYGTQTQGEIAEARGGPGQGPEQESRTKHCPWMIFARTRKSAAATMTAARRTTAARNVAAWRGNTLVPC